MVTHLKDFLRLESAGGILLVIAMLLAMIVVNTGLWPLYKGLLAIPLEIRVGDFEIAKPLLMWINDGLMAIFFFLIGLEVKREVLEGELSEPAQIMLPAVAAVGGVVVPALVFTWFNYGDESAMKGWAIPTATDIAFALGILSLLGKRVPPSLKLFLLTLAIIDDLVAILIIAIFYSVDISTLSLIIAAIAYAALMIQNWRGVMRLTSYLVFGLIMWAAVLKSGVHATIAGVLLAFTIPLKHPKGENFSPLRNLEHDLHPTVAFIILPLFAFANTGIPLAGMSLENLLEPEPLGIAMGLFLGKQLGVFTFTWAAVKTGVAKLPTGVGWMEIYGLSILTGIGFTMSLFISSLAFEEGSTNLNTDRLGILAGSFSSAAVGYVVLAYALGRNKAVAAPDEDTSP
ncbi:Na(+)/H(+) antiporter NhaA [bacterium BMS3Bbin11]|nr:Na(+)/H(+) antiporter NhaA [bacterium BMS3Abin11]GBE46291.1 Na(+)/H(+) antiporter NhaA [bacterium BMS3Bbin11]HDH15053.1 Na+/H+ antiporter NhaA [Gammaproteobacteria bacterium]